MLGPSTKQCLTSSENTEAAREVPRGKGQSSHRYRTVSVADRPRHAKKNPLALVSNRDPTNVEICVGFVGPRNVAPGAHNAKARRDRSQATGVAL